MLETQPDNQENKQTTTGACSIVPTPTEHDTFRKYGSAANSKKLLNRIRPSSEECEYFQRDTRRVRRF